MRKLPFLLRACRRLYDNKALYAQLVVTRNCNLACTYCNEYAAGAPHVPADDLLRRIDKLDALGVLVYDILGGEPLMHPDLPRLIAHIKARKNGANLVTVISNGFLLTTSLVERLNTAGLDLMQLSVDSVSPAAHSVKALKSLLPKLDMLRRHARFAVKIQTVLTPETGRQYDAFRELLADFPFAFSFSFLHKAGGRIDIQGQEYIDLFDRHRLWSGMELYRKDARALLAGDFRRPWRCLGGFKFLYVNADGCIQWCSQQKGAAVPLASATTADLQAANRHKPCEAGCCVGCARLVSHALARPLKSAVAGMAALPGFRR